MHDNPDLAVDMLFPRDPQSADFDSFDDEIDRSTPSLPSANSPSLSAPWQDEPPVRTRAAAPVDAGERQRRDILFSSKRRDAADDADEFSNGSGALDNGGSLENAWPHPDRQRPESPPRNGRSAPRRSDASSVSIVKSGVVDSMAYSLYSDGSIEAQMPEGMVRFSSIEELRSHLDQRH